MKKKILFIEDEEILLTLLQKKLTNEGYEVFIARDGKQGLKKIREELPDLILLDILMPKMSGFEVMEEMNKYPELKKIPVIVISNSGQPLEIDRIRGLGAKDWLIKTQFNPQEVVEKVKKQIGN